MAPQSNQKEYTSAHKWAVPKDVPKADPGLSGIDGASEADWDAAVAGYPPSINGVVDAQEDVKDVVNHPAHYTQGEIETIDYIQDVLGDQGVIDYCHGNVIKYTGSRLMAKGNTLQDAKKAIWYLNKLISVYEGSL